MSFRTRFNLETTDDIIICHANCRALWELLTNLRLEWTLLGHKANVAWSSPSSSPIIAPDTSLNLDLNVCVFAKRPTVPETMIELPRQSRSCRVWQLIRLCIRKYIAIGFQAHLGLIDSKHVYSIAWQVHTRSMLAKSSLMCRNTTQFPPWKWCVISCWLSADKFLLVLLAAADACIMGWTEMSTCIPCCFYSFPMSYSWMRWPRPWQFSILWGTILLIGSSNFTITLRSGW